MLICKFGYSQENENNVSIFIFLDENNNGVKEDSEPYIDGFYPEILGFYNEIIVFDNPSTGVFVGYIDQRARVQIKGYNEELQEGHAGESATSLFFAQPGTDYYVGISNGVSIDQSQQMVILPCYEGGPSEGRTSPALIEFSYMNNGIANKLGGEANNPSALATIEEIGATWGVGLQNQHLVYTSALVKRHVGLGPMGIGGLYQYDYQKGELSSYNLQGINTVNNGLLNFGSLQRKVVEGAIQHNATDQYALTKQDGIATYDIDAFDKVGKTGIGDIDIYEEGQQLWLVNLYQNSLVSIDVQSGQPDLNSVHAYSILDMPGLPKKDFLFRRNINAGGYKDPGAESFTDMYGTAWERNKYHKGGITGYKMIDVSNVMRNDIGTTDTLLYQSYRVGSQFEYAIPVMNPGTFQVRLHFAELDPAFNTTETDDPQIRLFNVLAEGEPILQDYNIISEAGGFAKAVTETFEVQVGADGVLNLEFVGTGSSLAKVMGIEIVGTEFMNSGALRPWGLTFAYNRGYIGIVSDASVSKNKDHLYGYVLSFDPNDPTTGFKTELAFPLKYRRERVSKANASEPQPTRTAVWEAWVENWEQTFIPLKEEDGTNIEQIFTSYPQPILSDIDFDGNGDMVIGLMDRWAHQVGYNNYPPVVGDRTFVVGYAAGDILKAFKNESGGYDLERENNDNIPYYKNDDGPSYKGEFFHDDYFEASRAHHGEIFTGGLGVMPESNEVILTVFNPVNTVEFEENAALKLRNFDNEGVFTQGTHAYSTESGGKSRGYLFINQYQFGKANGLGDIEFLMLYPGINIGNYVWCDGNGDGIQQANENGVPFIELELWCIDPINGSTLVSTTSTNAEGEYVFFNVEPYKNYEIRLNLDQPNLAGFQGKVTLANQGADDSTDSDARDDLLPGYAVIPIRHLDLRYNYSFDFGLLGPAVNDVVRTVCIDNNASNAVFDLCEIAQAVKVNPINFVRFYKTESDAIANLNSIDYIGECDYISNGETLYARVYVPGDIQCFSIAEVTLIVNSIDTDIILEAMLCEPTTIDLEDYIDLNQEFLMVFTHPQMNEEDMIVDIHNYDVTELPLTLYFKATFDSNCEAFGRLEIQQIPGFEIQMKESASICEGERFFISDLDITIPFGAENIENIGWQILGTGTATSNTTFSGFESYEPSADDIAQGYVDFILKASNVCQTFIQRVRLYILNEENIFVECLDSRDVYCDNDSIADFMNPLFPQPVGIVACDRYIYPELINVEVDRYDCLEKEDTVGRIVRHWLFELTYTPETCPEKERSDDPFFRCEKITIERRCTDTIFIFNFPDNPVECPPAMVTLECDDIDEYDENGRPHPNVSGFPKMGDIDLYPTSDILFCSYRTTYEDGEFIKSCGMTGMFKRMWTITNMCTKEMTVCEQWIKIEDTKYPIIRKDFSAYDRFVKDTVFINTVEKECYGWFYPSVYTRDSCSGIHQVKAMVNNRAIELYPIGDHIFRASEPIKIPYGYEPIEVIYESNDSCWNGGELRHYVQVKDLTPPTISLDDTISVQLTTKKQWVNAMAFDEGSYDNCNNVMVFARRVDWETFCVDLCLENWEDIQTLSDLMKIDPLSVLSEGDVEQYYRHMLQWMEEDYSCGPDIVEGWRSAIRAYWAKNCGPTDEHGNPLIKVEPTFIGGGWSKQIPIGCEDVCQDIMVEVLVLDEWCNWGKSWAVLRVEDSKEPQVLQKLDDITLSCEAYEKYYKSTVELAEAAVSSTQDSLLFAQLDQLLGGYTAAWADQQFRPTHMDGSLMDLTFTARDVICEDSTQRIKYSDTLHDGRVEWKYKTKEVAYVKDQLKSIKNGFVDVLCGAQITQDIWPILDDCGTGVIMRKFHVTTGCGDKAVTKTYVQNITIEATCALRPSMFSWPEDAKLCMPLTRNSLGNAVLPIAEVGRVIYNLHGGCRSVGLSHKDLILDVAGSETMKKIVRTHYVKDWCSGASFTYNQEIELNTDCGQQGQMTLLGTVNDINDRPISDVQLNVMKASDLMGLYSIDEGAYFMHLPYSFDQIYLEKQDNYLTGLSILDLILLQEYIRNPSAIKSPYQKIAGDLNNNNTLDMADTRLLRQLVMGERISLNTVSPWTFIDKRTQKGYADINQNITVQENNWVGVKMGDVNGNADYLVTTSRSIPYPILISKKVTRDGEVIHEFIANKDLNIRGLQFSINQKINQNSIQSSDKLASDIHFVNAAQSTKVLWTANTQEALDVAKGQILFSIYSEDIESLLDIDKKEVAIVVDEELQVRPLQVHRIKSNEWSHFYYPNPSSDWGTLKILAPVSGNAQLIIRNIDGKVLKQEHVGLQLGINQIDIRYPNHWAAGVYTYQIITNQSVQNGRFEIIP